MSVLARLTQAEDLDLLMISAGVLNLYQEALRRKAGRTLYGPEDIRRVFSMITVLTTIPEGSPSYAATSTRATATFEEQMAAITSQVAAERNNLDD